MKAAQLRQAILQAAVQGKLVPQNPQDESGAVLLSLIKAQKEKLIHDGKYKEKLQIKPIAVDDQPFSIPENWAWCRFGEVTLNRDSERIPISKNERQRRAKVYDYYGASGVIDKIDGYLFDKRLLLIGEDGANLLARSTPIAFVADGQYWVNNHAHVIDFTDYKLLDYFCLYINAIDLSPYVTGTAQPKMNQEKMNSIVIALPPLEEQQRIVSKVDMLMPLCDELEAAEKEFDSLEVNLAEYLPKSILQAAVRGKLIPQSIHDEPASELLKRIQEEKSCLIKAGKLKKEKPLPPISEEEKPYDLPDGWEWCRLGEIICLLSGRDIETKMFNDNGYGIPYITGASCINGDDILVTRWTETPITVSIFDDLIISCKGTIGKLAFNKIGDCHIARQLMALRFFSTAVEKKFVKLFLASYVNHLIIQAKSMIPGISREDILFAFLPLPPLAEQQRIVAKVDELMALCEQLKNIVPDNALPMADMQRVLPPLKMPTPLEPEEQYAMAARGNVSTTETKEHRQAIEDLFGDGADG